MSGAALRLRRIALSNFRNYPALTWEPRARIAVITGPNGAGKTNLLEAVSLLAPGRGFRGARRHELARRGPGADGRWAVAGRFEHPRDGFIEVATGTPAEGPMDKRIVLLDGALAVSRAAVGARIAMVWLTPEMSHLFVEGPVGRRRFLDRMVFALEPGHGQELAAYETAMSSRNRLLGDTRADGAWLAGLEESMARHAVAVAAARSALVGRLVRALPEAAPGLPRVQLELACPIAERLHEAPALAVEEWLSASLAARRQADREAGGAGLGPHRSDLTITSGPSGVPAALASTGEQKALLLSMVLAHAALVAEDRGFAPLLLLDEPAVHLDPERRAALLAILSASSAQILLTGTDAEPFRSLGGAAEVLRAGGGRLTQS